MNRDLYQQDIKCFFTRNEAILHNPPAVNSTSTTASMGLRQSQSDATYDFSPPDQMAEFVQNIDARTLERISVDKDTPSSVLSALAQHPCLEVRASVSENRNTPASVLRMLATAADPDVRYHLAENPHLPVELIRLLTADDNPYVACRAQRTLSRVQSATAATA
jgi:hypothetical protein